MRVLYTSDEIQKRVGALADAIREELTQEPVILGVLKGGFVFLADLLRALGPCCPAQVEFLTASSYGEERESSGRVDIKHEPFPIAGRDFLVVDDIVDTGRTLLAIREYLRRRGARWVWTCAFLDKPSRREVKIVPDFVGFEIEDVFVAGYGMDDAGYHRGLPYICTPEGG